MTIGMWIAVVFGWIMVIIVAITICMCNLDKWWVLVLSVVLTFAICFGIYSIGMWYCTSTAAGIRAVTDQKSNLANGLERTINVYTANGDKIAEYNGKIDLEMDQDYIKFDWEGKRYIYYNCFVEMIADIPQ